MCTYATFRTDISGSAKGPASSWFHVTDATVYFDHPVHAMAEHTLNIDFADPAAGPSARVAVELTAESARELIEAIRSALASESAELTDEHASRWSPSSHNHTSSPPRADCAEPVWTTTRTPSRAS
jgi:hypothetical protein